MLRKSGLWHLLQKIEAPEVTDIQLSRVHTRKYLNSLENQIPSDGTVKIEEDTYLSHDTLAAARHAGLPVHRLVYNRYPAADPVIGAETERYLRDYLQWHFPEAEWAVLAEAT